MCGGASPEQVAAGGPLLEVVSEVTFSGVHAHPIVVHIVACPTNSFPDVLLAPHVGVDRHGAEAYQSRTSGRETSEERPAKVEVVVAAIIEAAGI